MNRPEYESERRAVAYQFEEEAIDFTDPKIWNGEVEQAEGSIATNAEPSGKSVQSASSWKWLIWLLLAVSLIANAAMLFLLLR
jgi:hypothetical protein